MHRRTTDTNRWILKTFVFHLRPRTVRLSAMRFTYTWGLGGASAVLVGVLLTTGMLLKFAYTPVPDRAYDSIVALQTTVAFGAFIRSIHHWSANLLIVTVFLHMLRVFFTAAYTAPRHTNWWAGLAIFATILASNFTGYLLPWDQLAFWAVTICTALAAYLPVVGDGLRTMLIGGPELGAETLANFYTLHTAVLPVVLLLLLPFHFWRIRKAGGLAARPETGTNEEKVETVPHLLVREVAMAAAVIALVMLLAALWDAPLGAKANPGLSPNPTKAPWYFSGLQEMLLHFPPFLAVTVIPLLAILSLSTLPLIRYPDETGGRWFGSVNGRRKAGVAALAAILVGPAWIVGYADGLNFLAWLAPVLIPVMAAGIYWFSAHRPAATRNDGIQAVVVFFLTLYILLTITGTWFRGESMSLVWPWQ